MSRTIQIESQAEMGLDAFLDIITNVIGVLVLIACVIAIQVREFEPEKKAPLTQPAGDGQHLRLFTCWKGTVSELNHSLIKAETEQEGNRILDQRHTWRQFAEFVNSKDDWSSEYTVQIRLFDSGVISYQYEQKEVARPVDWEDSFRKSLSTLQDNEYVLFRVFPDSFSEFRKARCIAKKLGYNVAWLPTNWERIHFNVVDPNPSNEKHIPEIDQ